MRLFRLILGVILLWFALNFFTTGFRSFTDPEVGPIGALLLIGIGGLGLWGGIKLMRNLPKR